MNTNDTNAKIDAWMSDEVATKAAQYWTKDMVDLAEELMLRIEIVIGEIEASGNAREMRTTINELKRQYRWLDARHYAYCTRNA